MYRYAYIQLLTKTYPRETFVLQIKHFFVFDFILLSIKFVQIVKLGSVYINISLRSNLAIYM